MPLGIFGWLCVVILIFFPINPEGMTLGGKICGLISGSLVSAAVSRCFWLDIYRNPKKIYISDKGIGWDSFKRSFFVKWEDVTKVRKPFLGINGVEVWFKVRPRKVRVWDQFDDYEDLKSEIKRRATNAKITIK